jgi:hypothetical protein
MMTSTRSFAQVISAGLSERQFDLLGIHLKDETGLGAL